MKLHEIPESESFAGVVRQILADKNLKQGDIAKVLKVSEPYISSLLHGRCKIPWWLARALQAVYPSYPIMYAAVLQNGYIPIEHLGIDKLDSIKKFVNTHF